MFRCLLLTYWLFSLTWFPTCCCMMTQLEANAVSTSQSLKCCGVQSAKISETPQKSPWSSERRHSQDCECDQCSIELNVGSETSRQNLDVFLAPSGSHIDHIYFDVLSPILLQIVDLNVLERHSKTPSKDFSSRGLFVTNCSWRC